MNESMNIESIESIEMREMRAIMRNDASSNYIDALSYRIWNRMIEFAFANENAFIKSLINDDIREIERLIEICDDESIDDDAIIDRAFIIRENMNAINESHSFAIDQMNRMIK